MTDFYKEIENGYIIGIGTHGNDTVTAITENEYNAILTIIRNRPTDPAGYTYMLRADTLEWELVELPPEPEPVDEDATAEDYESALSELGVTV